MCLYLAGCSTNVDKPFTLNAKHKIETITIKVKPDMRLINGLAIRVGKACVITLKQYPICLNHELKHCFEDHWHSPEDKNGEYCH